MKESYGIKFNTFRTNEFNKLDSIVVSLKNSKKVANTI